MKQRLKVALRKFPDGDIIAIFPTEIYKNNPYEVMSYMQIGQHGAASLHLLEDLPEPTKEESLPIMKELSEIYELGEDPVQLILI